MKTKYLVLCIVTFGVTVAGYAQPPRPQGPPGPQTPPRMGDRGPGGPGFPPPGDWIRPHDTNRNGMLENEEFQAAVDRTFSELDKNKNGTLETIEFRRQPHPRPSSDRPPPPPNGQPILPPFFNRSFGDQPLSRAEFDSIVRSIFTEMDENGDSVLSLEEARRKRPADGPPPPPASPRPQPPPNARFVESMMRFGDKVVTGQPFSAQIVVEETRRLFDGSTVKSERTGAVYRDREGRTRREQPLDTIGGMRIIGSDQKAVTLIFINDFSSGNHYFLDQQNRIARRSPLRTDRIQKDRPAPKDQEKKESLGTKTIEGVKAEGTRVTFEIPSGQIGNEKPLQVITETWFSPELQVVVVSRHGDPIAGEHIFKLVNIRREEPAVNLFTVPAGFRIENAGANRSE